MLAIYRREMSAFFTSPIAYIFLAVFNVFAGLFLTQTCLTMKTTNMTLLFANMFLILLFLIPILTMKLLSEEKKQRTDQCLLTSPASVLSIVMGKYLAALTVFLCAIAVFLIYAIILSAFSPIIWSVFFGNLIGIFLLGVAFISVGLFISSLTENQVIAAIGSFVVMMLMYLIDIFASTVSNTAIQAILFKLSLYQRYTEFTTGLLNISSILFFISIAAIFNFLTVRVIERRRWN
ncbi:MAG: ABC transporter permease subunit [Oscillospiraceae bacterium]